ncbi:hypothetical protein [Thermogutta sp.]|jgi:hypothetical protein|uniref:hypothetical protein n=1 Tax=Thermogutta sp. TaxID=1962930 RepID=UPI00321FAF48
MDWEQTTAEATRLDGEGLGRLFDTQEGGLAMKVFAEDADEIGLLGGEENFLRAAGSFLKCGDDHGRKGVEGRLLAGKVGGLFDLDVFDDERFVTKTDIGSTEEATYEALDDGIQRRGDPPAEGRIETEAVTCRFGLYATEVGEDNQLVGMALVNEALVVEEAGEFVVVRTEPAK